jgi:hypothetical protein
MYDPALGRFAQADTIVPGGVQGLDRYAYVNNDPVRYTDPSGHICSDDNEVAWAGNCHGGSFPDTGSLLIFATEGNRTFSDAAKDTLQKGAWDVAVALADEMDRQCAEDLALGLVSNCSPTNPTYAFFAVYGGPVTVVRKAGTCSDVIGAQYPGCTAWGYSRSVNEIWIFDSAGGKNMNDVIVSHPNLIVHELGHSFYKAAGGYIAGSSVGDRNGFYGGYYQWQFGQDSDGDNGIEIFADMFLGWVYGKWEVDRSRASGLSVNGENKSAYMDKYMPLMINKAIGR